MFFYNGGGKMERTGTVQPCINIRRHAGAPLPASSNRDVHA